MDAKYGATPRMGWLPADAMEISAKRIRHHLRAGDLVEVRSAEEILATLDERGTLAGLPFMPEMFVYCGKRFHVWKRADKTCAEGNGGAIRKLNDTVHLKELRCDGSAHGGCGAGCLLFWNERWLKRIDDPEPWPATNGASRRNAVNCTLDTITRATRRSVPGPEDPEGSFLCQSTEINAFSSPLPWWDVRQYGRDLLNGNITIWEFLSGILIGLYNRFQHLRNGRQFGSVSGTNAKTPRGKVNFCPGDLVQVKSTGEISRTLDRRGKNCGLSFRPVMVPYCNGQYRVLRRVDKIIDPRTGKMVFLGGNCVILDGVVCTGRDRRFCPRAVYWYWRDIWLSKVAEPAPVPVRAEPENALAHATDYAVPADSVSVGSANQFKPSNT